MPASSSPSASGWRAQGLAVALSASLTVLSPATFAANVLVITDAQHPVTGAQAASRIIRLDAPQAIEAELSAKLPGEQQRAAAVVQQRLNEGGQALQQRLREAYQGVSEAWSLGITSIPAVVVDQRYVIYGEPNVAKALTLIATYRRSQP